MMVKNLVLQILRSSRSDANMGYLKRRDLEMQKKIFFPCIHSRLADCRFYRFHPVPLVWVGSIIILTIQLIRTGGRSGSRLNRSDRLVLSKFKNIVENLFFSFFLKLFLRDKYIIFILKHIIIFLQLIIWILIKNYIYLFSKVILSFS